MILTELPQTFAICRLGPKDPLPQWARDFFSVTRTSEELSIVCEESLPPPETRAEKGWRALKVEGPLDFALTGILHSLSAPLAKAKLSLFAISTFDTDYLLVRDPAGARAALSAAGFEIR